MKILMINSVCGIRSTGRICTDLAKELEKRGHIVRIAYGRGNVPEEYKEYAYRIGNNIDVAIHGVAARIKDNSGFESRLVTKRFIKCIEQFDPDLIRLHNLHGYYLNIPLLFEYLTRSNKRVIWTLHDCWPFTGHCCYFDYEGCDRWITGCRSCPQRKMYPASFIDKYRISAIVDAVESRIMYVKELAVHMNDGTAKDSVEDDVVENIAKSYE